MFYSHEILTKREHGVATIWLVATLGSKSSMKKIGRKAILDVDVPKAIETITDRQRPLALRLQGNLLYGVARVYSQQCGYVLTDIHSLRDKMKGMSVNLMDLSIDEEAGRARPDQINLPDDPACLPDLDMNFDLALFDIPADDSSRDASVLSPHTLGSSHTSHIAEGDGEDELQLEFPSGGTPAGGIGGFELAAGMSSIGQSGGGSRLGQLRPFDDSIRGEQEEEDDLGFELDEDGNLIDDDERRRQLQQRQSLVPPVTAGSDAGGPMIGSECGITDTARTEHEGGPFQAQNDDGIFAFDDGPNMAVGDDEPVLPSAQPFSPNQRSGAVDAQTGETSSSSAHPVDESSSSVTGAPQRRARPARTFAADERTELTNRDLSAWNDGYLANMAEATRVKDAHRAFAQAKKNAAFWVLGQGIAGVGRQFADCGAPPHPLAMFSGQTLLDALIGPESSVGSKRARGSSDEEDGEEEHDDQEQVRRVRPRGEEDEDHIGRGGDDIVQGFGDDDGVLQGGDDIDMEIGRHAPPSLPDNRSSMPWNISASSRHGSARPFTGLPFGGISISSSVAAGDLGRGRGFELGPLPPSHPRGRASRLTSASPLLGRGLQAHRYSSIELPGYSKVSSDLGGDLGDGGVGFMGDEDHADFQLYGPAVATVGTQWIAETLDNEAHNFLTFLEAEIRGREREGERERERQGGEWVEQDQGQGQGEDTAAARVNIITFDELLPPQKNSKAVGAQGLLHVLSLATKGLIVVRQDVGFGDIEMDVVRGEEDDDDGDVGGGGDTGDDEEDDDVEDEDEDEDGDAGEGEGEGEGGRDGDGDGEGQGEAEDEREEEGEVEADG